MYIKAIANVLPLIHNSHERYKKKNVPTDVKYTQYAYIYGRTSKTTTSQYIIEYTVFFDETDF